MCIYIYILVLRVQWNGICFKQLMQAAPVPRSAECFDQRPSF